MTQAYVTWLDAVVYTGLAAFALGWGALGLWLLGEVRDLRGEVRELRDREQQRQGAGVLP